MILNVSGRTDIVAFYEKWFMNRLKEGFVDVRNPFNPKLVSRINFCDVDLILFCTKNPIPILKDLAKIKIPFIFQVTITPYKNDIEPNVPSKKNIIEAFKKISAIIGKENIYIRYDPVFLSDKYNIHYHVKAFDKLCKLLNGYVKTIIISFLDEYKNVIKNKNILKYRKFTKSDYEEIGKNFSKIARLNDMTVQTCFEDNNLVLPLVVLEELDGLKRAEGEKGANARAAGRKLESYKQKGDLLKGVVLPGRGILRIEKILSR